MARNNRPQPSPRTNATFRAPAHAHANGTVAVADKPVFTETMPIELSDEVVDQPANGHDEEFPLIEQVVPQTYRWDIPGTNGYILRVQVTTDEGAAYAHTLAMALRIPTGDADKDGKPVERGLTPMESHWVRTTEPLVVMPSATVTLDHHALIAENHRLTVENLAKEVSLDVFSAHGIDVHAPQDWIDDIVANARVAVDQARAAADARCHKMASTVKMCRIALTDALEQNGLDDPKPVAPAKPDTSVLTVYADSSVNKDIYTDLAHANWITHDPATPSESAARGLREALKDGGYLWTTAKTSLGVPDQLDLDAAIAFIRASVKVDL